MNASTIEMDPERAWSPYVADERTPWDIRRAAHLARRAGFAAHHGQLEEAIKLSPAQFVDALLSGGEGQAGFATQMRQLGQTTLAGGDSRRLGAWWLYRMLFTPHQLLEKMTLFWHGHFATSAEKVRDVQLMHAQHELLRRHALGDIRQLVREISRDPAMLLYLDSATNYKTHPNENYARELMELFCLGEGHYSERDVQELARCFTGWEIRQGRFHFNRYQHDFAEKTILGRSGPFEDGAAIDWVLEQPQASRFVVRKLFRFFIWDEPEPDDTLLEPLAEYLRAHDFNVAVVLRRMLGSHLMMADETFGGKIRSPVELAVGLLRALEGTTDTNRLNQEVGQLGQALFYPPNVKGWDGGRTWINSSTLLGRANLVRGLLESSKTRFAGTSLSRYLQQQGLQDPERAIEWLAELLLAIPLPESARRHLVQLARPQTDESWIAVLSALASLPEAQLA